MIMDKEKFSFFDWIGFLIGIIVIGFILFILIWPLIDPTPNRSAPIQENLEKFSGNSKKK
jgi:hypothetical protein